VQEDDDKNVSDDDDNNDNNNSNSCASSMMIQVIRDGSLLTAENLLANTTNSNTYTASRHSGRQQPQQQLLLQQRKLSLRQPMLILDTPESIGMKLPAAPAAAKKYKRKREANDDDKIENNNNNNNNNQFTIRHVANLLGDDFPVRVINVPNQQELPYWTLGDLVDYLSDEARLLRLQKNSLNIDDDVTASKSKNHQVAGEDSKVELANDDTGDQSAPAASLPRRRPVRRVAAAARASEDLVLNQISLEFSHTPLRAKVQSPQFVRDLDWIDQAWRFPPAPAAPQQQQSTTTNKIDIDKGGHRKKTKSANSNSNSSHNVHSRASSSYPAVQYYCLTSAAGCYTDFHVDFGGSSVWYNVVSGEKHFCLIPPTPRVLSLYEEWLCSPTQESDFFAQIVINNQNQEQQDEKATTTSRSSIVDDIVYKIALKERQTLIIPAGWIHCVYTPSDSLVFGGNFLHGMDIETQLAVYSIEVRSHVLEQYRFPMFIQVHFAAASMYLHLLKQQQQQQQPSSCRRTSLLEVQSLGRLIEAVTTWWNPSTTMAATKTTDDDDDDDPNTNLSEVVRQVMAEHDCATFQEFLTMLQEERERVLLLLVDDVQHQQQNRAALASSSGSSAVAGNHDDVDKVEKAKAQPARATLNGDNGKSATSPRLRVKLPAINSSSNKVVVNHSDTNLHEESKLLPSSVGAGLVDIDDSDDKFRIEVSAASCQGRTLASPKTHEKVASNDNDEWLPSSDRKQQQRGRRCKKEPSPSVAAAGNNGYNGHMSPSQDQQQERAKKRAKKPEAKTTTARQRLLKRVGR
jgi:Cupin-like domain/Jumonji helical domain